MSGASIVANAKADPFLESRGFASIVTAYLGEHSPLDPYASPLFGDYRGLPPLLVQVGSTETLRDDAVRVVERAKRAGVDALLDMWDGVPHVWQAFPSLPETKKALKTVALFTERVWAREAPAHARIASAAVGAR
jgi:acetyl esterase/lipase